MSTITLQPTPFEISEFLLCARYGDSTDLEEMKSFVEKFGLNWLADARDDRGNTCLHMAGGNGHLEIVSYILPLLPTSSLITPNNSLSTPLHWISINYHLSILKLLCPLLPLSAFHLLNSQNKSPVQAAEEACESFLVPESTMTMEGEGENESGNERSKERVRREIVIGYLLGCMGLVGDKKTEETVLNAVGRDGELNKRLGEVKIDEEEEEEVKMSM